MPARFEAFLDFHLNEQVSGVVPRNLTTSRALTSGEADTLVRLGEQRQIRTGLTVSDEPIDEFRLFGGVEAQRGGHRVDVGHARQQCVLAVLLVEANNAVSVDELIDRVWAGEPPKRAKESLHTYLTRLRRALPAVPITRHGASYLLSADEDSIDLHRFRALAASARETDDAATFEQALALWRGEPLAGLDVPWAQGVRATLDKERAAVELDQADAELRLGRHNEILPTLAARAEQRTLDERLAGQLMLALYRAGRQADALNHYERIRRQLAEELGIDPSPALRELHQQILTGAITASLPPQAASNGAGSAPVPRQLPAAPRSFTGRLRELDSITETMDLGALPGATVVISAIGGTGGIGKTWLALHWAHQHVERFPDGQLFVNLRGFDPSGRPTRPQDAIRGFLDALGVEPAAIPTALDAQTALYRSLVADRRMLVVLDNAADTAQVVPLLPGGPSCTVIVTSRDRMVSLVNAHGAQPLPLDALSDVEARTLLANRLGADRLAREPDAVAALIECCAGLPLALSIVAGRALEHPDFPLRELADELREATGRLEALDEDPSVSVRSVLSWSYAALTEEQARVFGLLGLAPGPDISLAAAANLADLPDNATRTLLRSLERVSLVQQHVAGRYRMHDLVRLYAQEQGSLIPADVRNTALHRLRDFYLYTAVSCDRFVGVGRQPVDVGTPTQGCRPLPILDEKAAMAWYTAEYACIMASQAAALANSHYPQVWLFAWAITYFHTRPGLLHEDVASWQKALVAAEHLADTAVMIRVDRALGQAYFRVGEHDKGLEHLHRSLDNARSVGDLDSEARVQHSIGLAWGTIGNLDKAIEHAAEAARLEEQQNQPNSRGKTLNLLGWYLANVGRLDEALERCTTAYELARECNDRELAAETLDSLGYIALHKGEHGKALEYYREALDVCRDIGSSYGEVEVLSNLGQAYLAVGDPTEAKAAWERALELYRMQDRAGGVETITARLAELHEQANA
jgi:DNA-binding SARP family transcriptional activator/Tfp pilus assembly protein PilF